MSAESTPRSSIGEPSDAAESEPTAGGLLARVLRAYVLHTPINRGKGFVIRRLLWPLQPGDFEAEIPGGGRVRLRYRETLGLAQFLYGGFEAAEIHALRGRLRAGDVVFDVGANVGYLTVAMALAVGPRGRVIACEPAADAFSRLLANVALNGLENVEPKQVAVARVEGEVAIALAEDSAYSSTSELAEHEEVATARATRLDTLWHEAGSPRVALVKIDVEGAELGVLEGASELLATCAPTLLIESEERERVDDVLGPLGYSSTQPEGFAPANWLYAPSAPPATADAAPGVA